MPEYVRIPARVQAFQYDGTEEMALRLYRLYSECQGQTVPSITPTSLEELEDIIKDPATRPALSYDPALGLCTITTLTGTIELMPQDYLVHGPRHSIYRMDPESFADEHSEVED